MNCLDRFFLVSGRSAGESKYSLEQHQHVIGGQAIDPPFTACEAYLLHPALQWVSKDGVGLKVSPWLTDGRN
jgi:hypothetical protein